VTERLACLDTSVLISYLIPEEQTGEAIALLGALAGSDVSLVAPAFAWAEVGSVLRKKMRRGAVLSAEAEEAWQRFVRLPIAFIDTMHVRARAWELAQHFGLPTLYDAAFLAVTEVGLAGEVTAREFWTADLELVRDLTPVRPIYVRVLGE